MSDLIPTILPDFSKLGMWEDYAGDLKIEFQQCLDEGKDIEAYRGLFESITSMPPSVYRSELADVLFKFQMQLPNRPDYPYREPSDWEGIRALCAKAGKRTTLQADRKQLECQISGAWFGRICGCLLGKPVEGWNYDRLLEMLRASGNYPMHRYVISSDVSAEEARQYTYGLADRISYAPVDDDTNYTLLAQLLIDQYGRHFTPLDVMKNWQARQIKYYFCTAERVAYCNYIKGYQPPDCAIYKNPYREWIGAQIRGDYYGYINPGDPYTASEMAWRDASVTHTKNGIYGEMFIAAMIAQAAVEKNIKKVIQCGLNHIPATSRLHEAIVQTMEQYERGVPATKFFDCLHEKYDFLAQHAWTHTIQNAMIVTACLLYGEGDFEKSICMAVQTAYDTDCNGATVGSVLGMMLGKDAIGEKWISPIGNQMESCLMGINQVKISDVVQKTMQHIQNKE